MPKPKVKKPTEVFREHVLVRVGPSDTDGKDRYCKVQPSEVCVQWGGTVTFRCARGCGPLEVFVPTPSRQSAIFPRSGHVLAVPGNGKDTTFTVVARKKGSPHVVEYPYAVYCRGCNCFGKGSLPRMKTGP